MTETILKGLPLIIGLIITIFLPSLIDERTHAYASDEQMIGKRDQDPGEHDTLDFLLRWRDLVTSMITGIFVFQFAAAQRLTSENRIFNIPIADIALLVVVGLTPILLIFSLIVAFKLKLKSIQSRPKYWVKFAIFVVPLYLISLLFVYL